MRSTPSTPPMTVETLYYGNPLDAKTVAVNSLLRFGGPCVAFPTSVRAAPALSVSFSTLGIFQPPFHLQ